MVVGVFHCYLLVESLSIEVRLSTLSLASTSVKGACHARPVSLCIVPASFWESSNEIKIRWLATTLPNEAEFSPYRRQSILDKFSLGARGGGFDLICLFFSPTFCAASRVWQQTPSSARHGNCVLRPFTSPGQSPITATTTQSQHRTRAATTAASEGNNKKTNNFSPNLFRIHIIPKRNWRSIKSLKVFRNSMPFISYRPLPLRGSKWRL